jgi:hypothetical protein
MMLISDAPPGRSVAAAVAGSNESFAPPADNSTGSAATIM